MANATIIIKFAAYAYGRMTLYCITWEYWPTCRIVIDLQAHVLMLGKLCSKPL